MSADIKNNNALLQVLQVTALPIVCNAMCRAFVAETVIACKKGLHLWKGREGTCLMLLHAANCETLIGVKQHMVLPLIMVA